MRQVQPKLPENFEDDTWEKLQRAVVAVQTQQPIATSREELYRAVNDLCVHKMGAKLYDRSVALAAVYSDIRFNLDRVPHKALLSMTYLTA